MKEATVSTGGEEEEGRGRGGGKEVGKRKRRGRKKTRKKRGGQLQPTLQKCSTEGAPTSYTSVTEANHLEGPNGPMDYQKLLQGTVV